MSTETGESTVSINRRYDEAVSPAILDAMRVGAILRWHPKIRRAALEWPSGLVDGLPAGRSISEGMLRRLEREGVIEPWGINGYRLRAEI
jgi:hypothetical protein